MALSMSLKSLRFLRSVNTDLCICCGRVEASQFLKASHSVRPHETSTIRYLPCCYFSQPANNVQKSTPTKPGLLKRALHKTDDIFCAILGRISPWMLQEYGLFKIGLVQFVADAKSVYYINKRIRKEKLQLTDLHWKELYLKKQISNDLAKMTPTLIALSLPIVYYFVLPLMFLYPTVFLSNQFLSRDKLLRYYLKSYQERAALYPNILELLSGKLGKIQSSADRYSLQPLIKMLQSEQQVTTKQVLAAKNAFQSLTFSKLPRPHLKCLCSLCSLRTMFMPGFLLRRKLNKNLTLIQAMDHAIKKEGISQLDHLDLEKLCYERGLNVVHLGKSELEAWLQRWLDVSTETKDKDRSLIAHSAAFLVIGHPSCHQLHDIPAPKQEKKEDRD